MKTDDASPNPGPPDTLTWYRQEEQARQEEAVIARLRLLVVFSLLHGIAALLHFQEDPVPQGLATGHGLAGLFYLLLPIVCAIRKTCRARVYKALPGFFALTTIMFALDCLTFGRRDWMMLTAVVLVILPGISLPGRRAFFPAQILAVVALGGALLTGDDQARFWMAGGILLIGALSTTVFFVRERLNRRVAESLEMLADTLAKNVALFDASPGVLVTIDEAGMVLDCNKALESVFGYRPDELIGRNVNMLMEGRQQRDHDGYIRRFLETGEKRVIGIGRQVTGRCKDGTAVDVLLNIQPFVVKGQRCFAGVMTDLTSHNKTTESMVHMEKLAATGELIATITHDIKNPLSVISGNLRLINSALDKNDVDPERLRRAVGIMDSCTHRIDKLLSGLRSYVRKEDGAKEVEVFDLHGLINELLEWLEILLVRQDITVVTDLKAEESQLRGSRMHFEQLLMNLVANARDALQETDHPVINISTCNLNGSIILEVQDNGCGMDADTRAKVFDKFFTTKERGKGTGLGLSIVSTICEDFGGRLDLQSIPGKGTCFTLALPLPAEVRQAS